MARRQSRGQRKKRLLKIGGAIAFLVVMAVLSGYLFSIVSLEKENPSIFFRLGIIGQTNTINLPETTIGDYTISMTVLPNLIRPRTTGEIMTFSQPAYVITAKEKGKTVFNVPSVEYGSLYSSQPVTYPTGWNGQSNLYFYLPVMPIENASLFFDDAQIGDPSHAQNIRAMRVTFLPPVVKSEVEIEKNSAFKGEKYIFRHIIEVGKYPFPLYVTPSPIIEIKTAIGSVKKEVTQTPVKVEGRVVLEVEVPTEQVTETVMITPKVTFWIDPSGIAGALTREDCSGLSSSDDIRRYVPVSACKQLNISSVTDETFSLMIIPQPLILPSDCMNGEVCPEGYSCIKDTGNNQPGCVRKDVLDMRLGCQILGCPSVPGSLYSCSSAGICVETVFQVQDCRQVGCKYGECQSTGTCLLVIDGEKVERKPECGVDYQCGVGLECVKSGELDYCVRSGLAQELDTCAADEDCQTVCPGIEGTCMNGFCSYTGSCEEIEFGCKDESVVCAEGSACDEEKNVCVAKDEETMKAVLYIVAILAVVIGANVLLIVIRKKSKKKRR